MIVKDSVKSIKLISGEEIVGVIQDISDGAVSVQGPFSVARTMGSSFILVPWMASSEENAVVDINEDTGMPSKDDVFIYDLSINWEGWRVINIPVSDFVDSNPSVGDNKWNPSQLFGSAGLIQMQIIVMSSKYDSESISFLIDTIKFNL